MHQWFFYPVVILVFPDSQVTCGKFHFFISSVYTEYLCLRFYMLETVFKLSWDKLQKLFAVNRVTGGSITLLPCFHKWIIQLNISESPASKLLSSIYRLLQVIIKFLENSLVVSYEIKYTLSHDPAIIPLYIYPKLFKVNVQKRLLYECLFIIAPNWKQPKKSINRRMDKQMMIYSYNEYFSTIKK